MIFQIVSRRTGKLCFPRTVPTFISDFKIRVGKLFWVWFMSGTEVQMKGNEVLETLSSSYILASFC